MVMSFSVEKLLRLDRNGFVHSEIKLGSRWMEFHKTFTGYIYGNGVVIHIKFGQDV